MAYESLIVMLSGIIVYGVVYQFYVKWFDKNVIQTDPTRQTPAHMYLDHLGPAGRALFGGGALGGRQRRRTGGKTFRKHAIDGVGPTAVMLNDPVGDVRHRELADGLAS